MFTNDVADTKATRATDAGRAVVHPLTFTTELDPLARWPARTAAAMSGAWTSSAAKP